MIDFKNYKEINGCVIYPIENVNFEEIYQYLNSNEWESAYKSLENLGDVTNQTDESMTKLEFNLGQIAEQNGDIILALGHYRNSFHRKDKNELVAKAESCHTNLEPKREKVFQINKKKADCAVVDKDWSLLIDACRNMVKSHPDPVSYLRQYIKPLIENKEYATAFEIFNLESYYEDENLVLISQQEKVLYDKSQTQLQEEAVNILFEYLRNYNDESLLYRLFYNMIAIMDDKHCDIPRQLNAASKESFILTQISYNSIFQLLLEYGADKNIKDELGGWFITLFNQFR